MPSKQYTTLKNHRLDIERVMGNYILPHQLKIINLIKKTFKTSLTIKKIIKTLKDPI